MKQEKLTKFEIKNLKWIILFICIIGFIAILENVCEQEIINVDIMGYNLVSKFLISDFATPIAKVITNFGGVIFIVISTIILFVGIKNKKIGTAIILNLFIITFLNLILKNIIQRPRPTQFRLIDESGYSFPSGHSMISMAFYGFLVYLIYQYIKNKKLKIALIIVLSILPILIGISRIYLGVHYTTDVVGGFLISISYLIIYTRIFKKIVINEMWNNLNI